MLTEAGPGPRQELDQAVVVDGRVDVVAVDEVLPPGSAPGSPGPSGNPTWRLPSIARRSARSADRGPQGARSTGRRREEPGDRPDRAPQASGPRSASGRCRSIPASSPPSMNAWLRAGSHVMKPFGPSISSAVCAIGSADAVDVTEDPERLDQGLGLRGRSATGSWQGRRSRQGHASLGSVQVGARPRFPVVRVEREHAPVLGVVGLDLEQVLRLLFARERVEDECPPGFPGSSRLPLATVAGHRDQGDRRR